MSGTEHRDDSSAVHVTRNAAEHRFEGRLDGQLVGVVDYLVHGDVVSITHTGTEPAVRGRGIAGELTRQALDVLRDEGRRVQAVCPYTARYVTEHPEYADLIV